MLTARHLLSFSSFAQIIIMLPTSSTLKHQDILRGLHPISRGKYAATALEDPSDEWSRCHQKMKSASIFVFFFATCADPSHLTIYEHTKAYFIRRTRWQRLQGDCLKMMENGCNAWKKQLNLECPGNFDVFLLRF